MWKDWMPFSIVAPGHYYVEDLAETRKALYAQGYTARVSLTHKCEPRKLSYSLPKGQLVLHKEPEHTEELEEFLGKFDLPYHGCGLPAAVGQVMELTQTRRVLGEEAPGAVQFAGRPLRPLRRGIAHGRG